MSQWQPIRTAPKDGTKILGLRSDFTDVVVIAYYEGRGFQTLRQIRTDRPGGCVVSHWMPIPALPEPPCAASSSLIKHYASLAADMAAATLNSA